MLRLAVISIFPEMFTALTEYGVTGRAVEQGLLEVLLYNPRDYTEDVHRSVDDRPYGGGPGMVMRYEPLVEAIKAARAALPSARVVYLSPQGRKIKQEDLSLGSEDREMILLSGRYEGIDERVVEHEVDDEWSIGDYVLSGGELAAMVIADAMSRTIPGVLGHDESAKQDSFSQGVLDCPHYTRPEEIDGMRVPSVLLGGHHEQIKRWRLQQALGRTWRRRPDLLNSIELDSQRQKLLDEFMNQDKENFD